MTFFCILIKIYLGYVTPFYIFNASCQWQDAINTIHQTLDQLNLCIVLYFPFLSETFTREISSFYCHVELYFEDLGVLLEV